MKNIYIIDNSLITCTLIYRLLEDTFPNFNIQYFLDPTEILLKNLVNCDLIIIDETLAYHTGTEIMGYLYDYIVSKYPKDNFINHFPKVLFCSNIPENTIHTLLRKEKIYNKIPYSIVKKPFCPGELELAVEDILGLKRKHFHIANNPPSSLSSFSIGVKTLLSIA